MNHEKKTYYYCQAGHRKEIPGQRPLDPKPSIRTGCEECGNQIVEMRPQGNHVTIGWTRPEGGARHD
jgi:hypothetical protein